MHRIFVVWCHSSDTWPSSCMDWVQWGATCRLHLLVYLNNVTNSGSIRGLPSPLNVAPAYLNSPSPHFLFLRLSRSKAFIPCVTSCPVHESAKFSSPNNHIEEKFSSCRCKTARPFLLSKAACTDILSFFLMSRKRPNTTTFLFMQGGFSLGQSSMTTITQYTSSCFFPRHFGKKARATLPKRPVEKQTSAGVLSDCRCWTFLFFSVFIFLSVAGA